MKRERKSKIKPLTLALLCCFTTNHNALAEINTEDKNPCQGNVKAITTIGFGLLGAYLGNQVGDGNGKVLATIAGGAAGAWLGSYIGSEIDRRHCELDKIAKANQVVLITNEVELKGNVPPKVEVASSMQQARVGVTTPMAQQAELVETTGKVDVTTWHGMEHFAHGSDVLSPQAMSYFAAAAKQYDSRSAAASIVAEREQELIQQKQKMGDEDKQKLLKEITDRLNLRPIVLVGNTDDTGDSLTNQKISERRAKAVAQAFRKEGIPSSRIYFRGAGEKDPVADNRTEDGRASNRRVEIVELESKEKLSSYITLKGSNSNYYRAQKIASVAGDAAVQPEESASVQSPLSAGVSSDEETEQTTQTNAPPNKKSAKKRVRATVAKPEEKGSVPASVSVVASSNDKAELAVPTNVAPNKDTAENPNPPTASMSSSWLDYGGEPANAKVGKDIKKSMGKLVIPGKNIVASATGIFSNLFVKEAQAGNNENVYDLPCTADAPHYGGQYISLETGKSINTHKTSDYSPGLYQTTWAGTVNGHYLGVTPVAVLRDSFEPASNPILYVYANTEAPSSKTRPSQKIPLAVNVYPGENGILYRIYSEGKSNFVCADVVLPRHAPFTALAGKLYYKRPGQTFESDYMPSMLATSK